MQEPAPTLTLSIDPSSEPIAGSIRHPDGSATVFRGYMELAAALDRVKAEAFAASRSAGASAPQSGELGG